MAKTTKSDTIPKKEQERTKTQKKAILVALEKTLGVVTTACKEVGIARSTFYEWHDTDDMFKKAVDSIGDVAIDFVESQLFKQIKKGVPASTIFYLKTKAKKRGYIEKSEIDMNIGGEQIIGMIIKNSDNE